MINYIYSIVFLVFLHQCFHEPDPIDPATPLKVTLQEKWASDTTLRTTECVVYDKARKIIFVSNINKINPNGKDGDGFISVLKPNGETKNLKWITGLNDPKGLEVFHDKLYVVDLKELVVIDISTAKIIKRYTIPGAQFLNDVAADSRGTVYTTDTWSNKIFQLKDDSISVFVEGAAVITPTGLFGERDRLITGHSSIGEVKTIDYETKTVTSLMTGIPSLDGITKDLKHNYFVSNWKGEVYYVQSAFGQKDKVLDTKAAHMNAATISFMEDGCLLLIPTFYNNRIVAYEVKYE